MRVRELCALLIVAACLPIDGDITFRGGFCDEAECPNGANGVPGRCFRASQLGGRDFCVPSCDRALSSSASNDSVCLDRGAELVTCDPGEKESCPVGQSCYRTDLTNDRGVCTTMPVCSKDVKCPDSRPVCGADLLDELFPEGMFNDHLPCFVGHCNDPEEPTCDGACLRASVTDTTHVPDICVPHCDANQECPPGFYCESRAGSGYPNICVPGLPGFRCGSSDDCFVGECIYTSAGFGLCSIPCQGDSDCSIIRGARKGLVCAEARDGGGVCVTSAPFQGEPCHPGEAQSVDCPPGKSCIWFNPLIGSTVEFQKRGDAGGECRTPCDPDGTCPSVAGLPHVCLDDGAGGCYPAELGVPCETLGEGAACLGGLECLRVMAIEPDLPSNAGLICTLPCASDADCAANEQSAAGFCHADGYCRPPRRELMPCERPEQCGLFLCDAGMCRTRVVGDPCSSDSECYPAECDREKLTCLPER